MYDMLTPMPDKSGLPLPHAIEQISGHAATVVVMLSRFLLALSRRSVMEVIEHVEFVIASGFGCRLVYANRGHHYQELGVPDKRMYKLQTIKYLVVI